jgi:site-specific DNA-methyltransferase (adenine-specific)
LVITSPPYLLKKLGRDVKQQAIGQEPSLDGYIEHLLGVFDEVQRVLKKQGTLFLNIGDTCREKNLMMVPARLGVSSFLCKRRSIPALWLLRRLSLSGLDRGWSRI